MPICVGVRAAEGLVLAADSAVSLQGTIQTPQGPEQVLLQTFAFGNKVTRVEDYPIGVMTWGLASIEARSIQSLIMEFEYSYDGIAGNPGYTVCKIADDLLTLIRTRYEAAYPKATHEQTLGLYVGGFSANEFFSSQFVHEFPTSKAWTILHPDRANGSKDFGASWWGRPTP